MVASGTAPRPATSSVSCSRITSTVRWTTRSTPVPPLLHVHLEQVAQVVQAGRGGAQVTLLLDRGGLGVALDHDQPLQLGPVLPWHLAPHRLALVLAEPDLAARVPLGQEDAPAVL